MSWSTKATRSGGESVSSTTSMATPTEVRDLALLLGVAGSREVLGLDTDRLLAPHLPGPELVETDSGDDGREPGRAVFDDRSIGAHQPEPRFLNRVLGLACGPQHPVGDRSQVRLATVELLPQRSCFSSTVTFLARVSSRI